MKMLDDVYTTVEGLSEHDEGSMLETYGKDLEVIRKQAKENVKKVWTLVDGQENNLIAITGYHLINRVNYIITEEEWKNENEEYLW